MYRSKFQPLWSTALRDFARAKFTAVFTFTTRSSKQSRVAAKYKTGRISTHIASFEILGHTFVDQGKVSVQQWTFDAVFVSYISRWSKHYVASVGARNCKFYQTLNFGGCHTHLPLSRVKFDVRSEPIECASTYHVILIGIRSIVSPLAKNRKVDRIFKFNIPYWRHRQLKFNARAPCTTTNTPYTRTATYKYLSYIAERPRDACSTSNHKPVIAFAS